MAKIKDMLCYAYPGLNTKMVLPELECVTAPVIKLEWVQEAVLCSVYLGISRPANRACLIFVSLSLFVAKNNQDIREHM